jgi:uncharacterized protein (DUF433 family)
MVYRGETRFIQCNTIYNLAMEYIDQRNGGLYVAGSRVSLDSVVYAFLRGESPEGIVYSFPSLNLRQVYGAITYYLENRDMVDDYLQREEAEFDRMAEEARKEDPAFYAKLDAARAQLKAE